MIDYNQDIAPLQQQYFPMLTGQRGFDRAMQYRQQVIMPMQQQTLNMQKAANEVRAQDLAFKKSKFELRQARDKAKKESEAYAMKPMIDQKLNELLNDNTKSAAEKFVDLGKMSLAASPYLTAGSPLTQMFNATNNTLRSIASIEDKKEKKAEDKEKQDLNLISLAAQAGQFDLAQGVAETSDASSTAEQIYMAAGKQQYETEQGKLAAAQQKAQTEARDKRVGGYVSTLQKFAERLGSVDFSEGLYKLDDAGNTVKDADGNSIMREGTDLDNTSKNELIGALKFLYPSLPQSQFDAMLKNNSDPDLIRLAQETISKELVRHVGSPDASKLGSSYME